MMVFRLSSQNYSKELLQISYVNRKLCILGNANDRRSKKFSFYLISRIYGVQRCKNWFLRQFLEFEASVCLDTAYSLSTEQFLVVEEWVTDIFHVLTAVNMRNKSFFICFYVSMFLCILVS